MNELFLLVITTCALLSDAYHRAERDQRKRRARGAVTLQAKAHPAQTADNRIEAARSPTSGAGPVPPARDSTRRLAQRKVIEDESVQTQHDTRNCTHAKARLRTVTDAHAPAIESL
jgi:hypothetical protein